jgi:DNA-binding response OmpR family regulator
VQRRSSELLRAKAPDFTPPHVLIVDDEPMIPKLVSNILLAQGFTVSTAETGNQAVDLFRRAPNILVAIVDWHLPGISGDRSLTNSPRFGRV